MSALAEPVTRMIEPAEGRGFAGEAWRRFRRNRAALVSLVVVAAIVLIAIFAQLIAPYDPAAQDLATPSPSAVIDPLVQRDTGKYEGPSAEHLFGTDDLARDIFSRTVFGLRMSISAAFFAIVVVTFIGVSFGTAAVAGPRVVDVLLMRLTDVAYAFPDLLLIILLRSAFGTELFGAKSIFGVTADLLLLFLAISLTAWPTMARLVRAQLLSIRETEYTQAAIALGASPTRIAVRHWLPNAMGPVIVEATFLVPRVIFAEAALSFIGVGASAPSLGSLISNHFGFVGITWTALFFPTALLALLFVAFSFLGDGIRDALDPRSKS